MSWNVTIEVADCASPSTLLSGAKISMGAVELGVTDGSGRYVATLDDFNNLPIFRISKDDYITDSFSFDKEIHSGTTQTVCLVNPPSIPDGQDPDIPGESGGQEFGGNGCFIVTATTGSSESVEVSRLRHLRDRVSAASRLGAQLINVIYGEYEQFSPAIAAELEQNVIAQKAALWVIVRPLLAWYTLAGILAFEQADPKAVKQAAQDVLNTCPRYLGGSSIIALLDKIRAGDALPPDTNPLLLDFAPRIQAATRLPFASWAILDPLVRAWRSATDRLDVVDEVAQWLATAPLELLAPPNDPQVLDVELGVLVGFFDFRPMLRLQLGERLAAAWPDAASALGRAGFVSQTLTND
ncbi:MAG: CFI-box-CTERM domain-containing protein [Methylococcaceae bacterium]|jgi:hypothetical protein